MKGQVSVGTKNFCNGRKEEERSPQDFFGALDFFGGPGPGKYFCRQAPCGNARWEGARRTESWRARLMPQAEGNDAKHWGRFQAGAVLTFWTGRIKDRISRTFLSHVQENRAIGCHGLQPTFLH